MVAVPNMSLTRRDGGLGSLLASAAGRLAVVGIAAAGAYTAQVFTSQGALEAEYTSGPLVDAASYVLARCGWVLCCRAATGTSGSNGSVWSSGAGAAGRGLTAGGSNTSTAVPTLAGTPTTPYPVNVKVTIAGANFAAGTARVQYSLDGGLTWSANMTPSAVAQALGDIGVTLVWADGSFVVSGGTWAGYAVPGTVQGTATLAVTGTPNDTYEVKVRIVRGGASLAAGTATYKLSLDGGDTWGPETAMPINGVVTPTGTGLTLTWTYSSGTGFVAEDIYAVNTLAPTYDASGMATAYSTLDLSDDEFEGFYFTGAYDAALCVSLEALLAASETALRPRFAIVGVRQKTLEETRSAWELAVRADFVSFTGLHVVPCAGHTEVIVPSTNRQVTRSAALAIAGRIAIAPLSEDLAWVERGPLPGVVSVDYDGADNPSLNDFGFTTLRKRRSRTARGIYVTNPHTGAASDSDFKLLQYLRVWNEGARVLIAAMERHSSRTLRTIPKPLPTPTPPVYAGRTAGAIDDREAAAIEADADRKLRAALLEGPVQHVTSVAATINRTVDVVATRNLAVSLSLGPMGYAKTISLEIGFALGGVS